MKRPSTETCAYPVAGLDETDPWFCGKPATSGSPYCTKHANHVIMLQKLSGEAQAGRIQRGWSK